MFQFDLKSNQYFQYPSQEQSVTNLRILFTKFKISTPNALKDPLSYWYVNVLASITHIKW